MHQPKVNIQDIIEYNRQIVKMTIALLPLKFQNYNHITNTLKAVL